MDWVSERVSKWARARNRLPKETKPLHTGRLRYHDIMCSCDTWCFYDCKWKLLKMHSACKYLPTHSNANEPHKQHTKSSQILERKEEEEGEEEERKKKRTITTMQGASNELAIHTCILLYIQKGESFFFVSSFVWLHWLYAFVMTIKWMNSYYYKLYHI